jgi:hypothetical protein
MNGFEKHNIDHLSASSLNLWANAPDVWVMQYLHGTRTPMGAAAWRGICTEDAVVDVLMGGDIDAAVAKAEKKFDSRFPIGDETTTKERSYICYMTALAVEELKPYGKPEFPDHGKQHKISITAKGDGYEIPVIGFLDLVFPEQGLIVDLKTTTRAPSVMTHEHQLQRCIYQKAMGNMGVKFLYVTPKKTALLEDGDVAETLARAKQQINRLEAFLKHNDKDSARATVPVNTGSFYWRGSEALREEFYGL